MNLRRDWSAVLCLVVAIADGDTLTTRCGGPGAYEQVPVPGHERRANQEWFPACTREGRHARSSIQGLAPILRQHGVDLHTINRILGHSSVQVTKRAYAHLPFHRMRDGLEALNVLHSGLHSKSKTLRSF